MTAAVLICLLSMTAFCLCARLLITVATASRRPLSATNFNMTTAAWRMARNYIAFSLVVLMAAAFIGTVTSFIEIFT